MKKFATLSAFAALSSALLFNPAAKACDGHDKKGSPLSRMDSNADGKVTQQEMLAAWTARFDETDINKDGKVTSEERDARREAKKAKGKGHGRMDREGDEPKTKADLSAKVGEHFKRLDSNGDGVLSDDELSRGKRRGHGGHHGRGQRG